MRIGDLLAMVRAQRVRSCSLFLQGLLMEPKVTGRSPRGMAGGTFGHGIVTDPAIGEANGFLAVINGWFVERIHVGIGDAVIHGVEACAAGVGEPRDLRGRWLAGEERHAIVSHVHGEIDQNVDPIVADFVGERGVASCPGHRARRRWHRGAGG